LRSREDQSAVAQLYSLGCVLKLRASNIRRNIERTNKLFKTNHRCRFKSKGCLASNKIRICFENGVMNDQEVVVEEFANFFFELTSSLINKDISAARISEAHIKSYYPAAIHLLG
jgi:hypothetical protein